MCRLAYALGAGFREQLQVQIPSACRGPEPEMHVDIGFEREPIVIHIAQPPGRPSRMHHKPLPAAQHLPGLPLQRSQLARLLLGGVRFAIVLLLLDGRRGYRYLVDPKRRRLISRRPLRLHPHPGRVQPGR